MPLPSTLDANAPPEIEVEGSEPVATASAGQESPASATGDPPVPSDSTADEVRMQLRMIEAMLFAAAEPLAEAEMTRRLPEGIDLQMLLAELQSQYADRGVNLHRMEDRWAFRTAEDLAFLLRREMVEERRLSRAAIETLAIIAYHQPVTRAEIEEIRGVAISKGTLDTLLEAGWVRLRGRRRTPGRPVTFGTTPEFLDHFGLEAIGDLPGLGELKAAGLLETLADLRAPTPEKAVDDPALRDDEDPLEAGDGEVANEGPALQEGLPFANGVALGGHAND
jgi:segregation and condensation protein B